MHKTACIIVIALLQGCAGEPVSRQSVSQPVSLSSPGIADFSGHWELDYGRSDDVDRKLRSLYREWRREAERRARGDQYRASMGAPVDSRDFRALVDVARLAELITDSQVLDIEQTNADIEIRRENNFALTCVFREGEPEVIVDELGAEVCGWDAHQLVFHIRLPDGLDIRHRLTMSEDTERLHIATQVDSRKSAPFTLNRFYFRFDPLPEDYSCEYTLSRGNVCQSEVN
jgi:hypothetical protein